MRKRIVATIMTIALIITSGGMPAKSSAAKIKKFNETNTAIEENLSIKSTNSFGELLADSVENEINEQENNEGYNVFSVEVDGKVADVSMETQKDCTLVVGIYSEDGIQMVASGDTDVAPEDKSVQVSIEIETMPEYFLIRAFLVEADTMHPLCAMYESSMYTAEMQEFLTKTTEDFDADRVLNLDEDTTNNYAVYSEETIVINSGEQTNNFVGVDEENSHYVIENIDEVVMALKKDDIFACEYQEGKILIVKVGSIEINGTTATITGVDTSMEETFDYVRIENDGGVDELSVDESTCGENVEYEGKVDETQTLNSFNELNKIEGTVAGGLKYKFAEKKAGDDDQSVKISGELSLNVETSIKAYFLPDTKYIELKLDYSAKFNIGISGNDKTSIPLGKLTYSPVIGVYVEFTPSIVAKASAKLDLSASLEGMVGFRADQNGLKNLTSSPVFKPDVTLEGTIFIGFSMVPKVKVISDKVAKVEMTAEVGGEIVAKYFYGPDDKDEYMHTCSECIDGDINAKTSLAFEVVFANAKKWTFGLEVLDREVKLMDFYYSYDDKKIVFTECPNTKYKVTVLVKTSYGDAVKGALVNNEYSTDYQGKAELYLPNGKNKIIVSKGGNGATKNIIINKKTKKLEFTLLSSYDEVEETVARNPLKGKKVKENFWYAKMGAAITENGDLYTWGKNEYTNLGNSTTLDSSVPTKILTNVKEASISESCFAVTENGDLYAWGYNAGGELGNGTTKSSLKPIKIMEDVKKIYANYRKTAVITENGDLYTWGKNSCGELGNGTTESNYTPVKILEDVVKVSNYDGESYAAITSNGDLYTWGRNYYGILGNGTTENAVIPTKVLENVESVNLFQLNGSAITADGDLYTWGENGKGHLGDGTTVDSLVPIKVMEDVVQYQIYGHAAGALQENGNLYVWGENWEYDLGNGNSGYALHTPTLLLDNIRWFEFGDINYAITKTNDLYDWSGCHVWNSMHADGLLGVRVTPTKVFENVKSFSEDSVKRNTILTTEGDLYTWGEHGASTGSGTEEVVSKPIKILENVTQYTSSFTGGTYGAITTDGDLYVWGKNQYSAGGATFWGVLGVGAVEEENILIPTCLTSSATAVIRENTLCSLAEDTSKTNDTVKKVSGLEPNTIYNFYVVKEELKNYGMVSDNLLYITQASSDSEGNLIVTYQGKEDVEDAIVIVKSLGKKHIQEADITVSDMIYTWYKQIVPVSVVYEGEILTEGVDYEIEGEYQKQEIGEYEVIIQGIGEFSGTVSKKYRIYCEHKYDSWVVEPTKYSQGYTAHKCSICDDFYKDNYVEVLGVNGSASTDSSVVSDSSVATDSSQKTSSASDNNFSRNSSPSSEVSVASQSSVAKVKGLKLKNKKSRKILVTWKKGINAKGYQVQYATNKKFKSKKSKLVTKTKVTLKKLKRKKTYYIRVRAYKVVNGKKVYGKWSSVKKIKVKK